MGWFLHVYRSARTDEFIAVPSTNRDLDEQALATAIRSGAGLPLSADSLASHLRSTVNRNGRWVDVIVHR